MKSKAISFANLSPKIAGLIFAALMLAGCQTMRRAGPERDEAARNAIKLELGQGEVLLNDCGCEIDLPSPELTIGGAMLKIGDDILSVCPDWWRHFAKNRYGIGIIRHNFRGLEISSTRTPGPPPPYVIDMAVLIDRAMRESPELIRWVRENGVTFSAFSFESNPGILGYYHIADNRIAIRESRGFDMKSTFKHEIEHAKHYILLLNYVQDKMLPSGIFLSRMFSEILARWSEYPSRRGHLSGNLPFHLGVMNEVWGEGRAAAILSTSDREPRMIASPTSGHYFSFPACIDGIIGFKPVANQMLAISSRVDPDGFSANFRIRRGKSAGITEVINAMMYMIPEDMRVRMKEMDSRFLWGHAPEKREGVLRRLAPYHFATDAERKSAREGFGSIIWNHPTRREAIRNLFARGSR